MLAKIEQRNLEKALKKIEGVADKKASMAVLSMVLITPLLENNLLELTATDLEIGYKTQVPVEEIQGEGMPFCVPARKFYEIIKNFPEEVLLQLEENKLIIKDAGEKIVYSLAITSNEEFPSLPEFSDEQGLEIQGSILAELIDKTIFCTSKEESRFVLGGIFFEPLKEEGKFRLVASDGYRLAYLEKEVKGIEEVNFEEGFIVARKAAKQMSEIAEEELLVKLSFLNNYVVLKTHNSLFFARTIEGSFPDYKNVIPSSNENILKIDRKHFINALKRVSLIAPEKFKPITINFQPNQIILSSQETEMGKAEIKLEAEYQGQPISINYNAQYLLDALDIMKSEEIEMKIGDEKIPAIITGYRDEGFLYLIMPMVL